VQPVVSFDLDGVVWYNPFSELVAPRLWAHARTSPILAGLEPAEADKRALQALRDASHARRDAGDFVGANDWDALFARVCKDLSIPGLLVSDLYAEACRTQGAVRLMPGARECLEGVRRHGARVIALTNGFRKYQWPVLQALGVAECFNEIITPEVSGFVKPDPRVFQAVEGLVAHVGDLVLADVFGANQAGVRSIWLDDELPEPLRDLPIGERTSVESIGERIDAKLERSPTRSYYPHATRETCMPSTVVASMTEAGTVLGEWLG
jgi:putative hydrolase of the HAD superfamily